MLASVVTGDMTMSPGEGDVEHGGVEPAGNFNGEADGGDHGMRHYVVHGRAGAENASAFGVKHRHGRP